MKGGEAASSNEVTYEGGLPGWVTDKGTYFANQTKFVPKDNAIVEDDYISNINNIVKNRLNIGKLIIKNDYYKYLLK